VPDDLSTEDFDSATESALDQAHAEGLAGLSEVEQVRTELAAAKDRYLRSQAELDNYRKRARRELEEQMQYANLPLLRDVLPVLDNMHRAIAAAEKSADASALLEGIRMVLTSLEGALARHGCTKIEALNQPFDPAFHEAISQMPNADLPPHTVTLVAQEGYKLYDRVIRAAQVIVSVSPQ
jgi:molecular chaperone GrpE